MKSWRTQVFSRWMIVLRCHLEMLQLSPWEGIRRSWKTVYYSTHEVKKSLVTQVGSKRNGCKKYNKGRTEGSYDLLGRWGRGKNERLCSHENIVISRNIRSHLMYYKWDQVSSWDHILAVPLTGCMLLDNSFQLQEVSKLKKTCKLF